MSPEPKRYIKVAPAVRETLGDLSALGIEVAYNTGVTVVMPQREPRVDINRSIENILANPTEAELIRWEGKTPEEIRADIESYIRGQTSGLS